VGSILQEQKLQKIWCCTAKTTDCAHRHSPNNSIYSISVADPDQAFGEGSHVGGTKKSSLV